MTLRVRTYRLDAREPRVVGAGQPVSPIPLALREPVESPVDPAQDRFRAEG